MNLPEAITRESKVCILQIFCWALNINDEGGGEPPFYIVGTDWSSVPTIFITDLQPNTPVDTEPYAIFSEDWISFDLPVPFI